MKEGGGGRQEGREGEREREKRRREGGEERAERDREKGEVIEVKFRNSQARNRTKVGQVGRQVYKNFIVQGKEDTWRRERGEEKRGRDRGEEKAGRERMRG